jgi:hypothetical protein
MLCNNSQTYNTPITLLPDFDTNYVGLCAARTTTLDMSDPLCGAVRCSTAVGATLSLDFFLVAERRGAWVVC